MMPSGSSKLLQMTKIYSFCDQIISHCICILCFLFSLFLSEMYACVLVAQSCSALCDPMDCSLPGSSRHGVFQARILEQVAISYSRGLPDPGIEPMSPALAGRFFTTVPPGKPLKLNTSFYFIYLFWLSLVAESGGYSLLWFVGFSLQ